MTAGSRTNKAVILARGLGTRMRKADATTTLAPGQASAAETGVKAMIPIEPSSERESHTARPFVDYLVSSIADSGFTDLCLVIGPEHNRLRARYERIEIPKRIKIQFAIQERPLGTANAVLAAEEFAGDDSFVVLNSDNYYPPEALEALHYMTEPAIVGFDREALVRLGNVPVARTGRFGALDIDPDGYLRRILVTPTVEMVASGAPVYASMNCFLFTKEIFRACRDVPLSARGEYELPQAMHLAIEQGWMRFRVVKVSAPVLDMSTRADIARVADSLGGIEVRL